MRDQIPSFNGLRIYPRGFLGADVGIRIKDTLRPFNVLLQQHEYHPDMFKPTPSPVEVNWNIEEMYRYMLKNNRAMLDFNFREKVLRLALYSFGKTDFFEWVKTQFEGPATGELHGEFIEDTLRFIFTGKRTLAVHSWASLLNLSDIGTNVTNVASVLHYFMDPNNPRIRKTYSLVDIIQLWCGHEGGYEDLVQTLHVLFGDVDP